MAKEPSKVGAWLRANAPDVLEAVGGIVPMGGGLQAVARLIDREPDISSEQKLEFARLVAEQEAKEQHEVTERWKADNQSDLKITKLVRPWSLIVCVALFTATMIWDSADENFNVNPAYLTILETLLLTVFGAFFAGRSLEKGIRTWRSN